MNKTEKKEVVARIKEKFTEYPHCYVTNTETVTVAGFNKLRRVSFQKGIEVLMAKNSLIQRALAELGAEKFKGTADHLKGVSVLFFTKNPKDPANIISDYRNESKGDKPSLKFAIIDQDLFVGDNQLSLLKQIKTQQELLGDVLMLLQSPIKSVASGLSSRGQRLAGALQTIAEKQASNN